MSSFFISDEFDNYMECIDEFTNQYPCKQGLYKGCLHHMMSLRINAVLFSYGRIINYGQGARP
ncbi:hypothetical protein KAU33_10665, partial [Candidatus Dependentiae bacterium]|nr:hypothetical protein [Candidatus Dependentiae bacterium]